MARYTVKDNMILTSDIEKPRVIIYDDKNIQYIVGNYGSFEWEPQVITYENIDGTRTHIPLNATMTMSVDDAENLSDIKLDDTLMRRIALFNKEQECKRLDEEIMEKKATIKELDKILKDKDKRVEKLKRFIADLWDMDIDDDDYDWDDD